jgi:hypothetical protein
LLLVEGDLYLVSDCLLRRVGDEALSSSEDLNLIWNVPVVDRNLKLTLTGFGGVYAEGAQNADNAVGYVGYLSVLTNIELSRIFKR